MGKRVTRLSDEELARQLVDLMGDKAVAKVLRAIAIQDELERRHGQKPARKFVNDDRAKRNRARPAK